MLPSLMHTFKGSRTTPKKSETKTELEPHRTGVKRVHDGIMSSAHTDKAARKEQMSHTALHKEETK